MAKVDDVDRLRSLYRRSIPEDARRKIRNVIKLIRNRRDPKALSVDNASKMEAKALVSIVANADKTLVSEAKALVEAWRLSEALEKVTSAIQIKPSQASLSMRARILANMGRTGEAVEANYELLRHFPFDVAGYRQLRALGEKDPPVSVEGAIQIVKEIGESSATYLRAAEYLYFFGLFDGVLEACERGLELGEQERATDRRAKILYNLLLHKGYALEALHLYDQALSFYEAMAEASFEVRTAIPIARCLLELDQPAKGISLLRRAHMSDSDPQPFHPTTMDLLQSAGRIRESYQLYRKRPISLSLAKAFKAEKHPLDIDLLSGEYRSKNALILAEGGPADELRMSSIYSELADCFGRLTITCEPRLQSAMERNFPNISFLPTARHRRELVKDLSDRSMLTDARLFQIVSDDVIIAAKDADIVCSLLDTLADIRPDRASFRKRTSSLIPDPTQLKHWKAETRASKRLKIGLSWRSMLQSVARDRHYLIAQDLAPLAEVDADFWLFQPAVRDDEIEYLRSFLTLHIPNLDLIDDIEGQMALAANMDLVISPFATTGELAGAVGTPTVLISTTKSTTWRRNPDGSDIWHPSTRIVTGNPIHDRVSVVREVSAIISSMVEGRVENPWRNLYA